MKPVGVISCGSRKVDHATEARLLYVGSHFALCRSFIEARTDRWFILSARHGLIEPHRIIEPYDLTLNTMSKVDRYAWNLNVQRQIATLMPDSMILTTAGSNYREALPQDRTVCPWDDLPVKQRGIGWQRRFLTQQMQHPTWHTEWLTNT